MNKYVERIYNGVAKENPTFVLMLGMCPTLAVSTAAINGLGMGGHGYFDDSCPDTLKCHYFRAA